MIKYSVTITRHFTDEAPPRSETISARGVSRTAVNDLINDAEKTDPRPAVVIACIRMEE